MYKRLPIDEKLTAIKRVLDGERVSRVCRDEGISRTIFYKWLNDYKKTGPRGKRKVLTARVVRGNDHWKSFSTETRRRIMKLALKNPLLSPQKIAQVVDASPSGIWYLLKRNGLNTGEARRQYIYRNGKSLVRERPVSFKLTMMRRFEAGEKVAKICRDFGVSRTIFYRWLKRYEQERSSESLESLRPAGEEHYRFIPEAPELISKIVASDPRLSPQKISTTLNSEASKKILEALCSMKLISCSKNCPGGKNTNRFYPLHISPCSSGLFERFFLLPTFYYFPQYIHPRASCIHSHFNALQHPGFDSKDRNDIFLHLAYLWDLLLYLFPQVLFDHCPCSIILKKRRRRACRQAGREEKRHWSSGGFIKHTS
ncbi:MAG: Transposase [Microgenomates group bacterium GW2011_GWC1_39_7]|nr:MAG: Transposase [Microgenomates group bacterium GW2011_GWC1_39_7]